MYDELKDDEDLQGLINAEAHEDLHLDFKSALALSRTDRSKSDISKDVSSFANADGGTIVYGLIESDHKASSLDDGVADIDKEWLESVVMSTISPRIDGIIIHPIIREGGKFAYIVHIPKSFNAPHQANDHRFYKRFNFRAVPMEQYEVLDVMNRDIAPSLTLDFDIPTPNLQFTAGNLSEPIPLDVKVVNHSETPAEYAVVRLRIHSAIEIMAESQFFQIKRDLTTTINNIDMGVHEVTRRIKIPESSPIWKGEALDIANEPIYLKFPHTGYGESLFIEYEVKSPHMPDYHAYRGVHFNSSRVTRITAKDLFTEAEIAAEISL